MLAALVAASGAALAENIAGGNDDIYGKGDRDRLFGDTGDDDVFGGKAGDRLQSGLG
jgi:hypothetical protein